MADLNINLNGLELKNPVLTASGTFGYGLEFQDFIQLDKLGGFIVKGTTLKHREGNSYPRMAETPSGMLNAVALQNKGVDYFIERIYPEIKDIETNILVNVSGSTITDYAETAEKINALDHIPAIELNISCPNVKQGGMNFGVKTDMAQEVVRTIRQVCKHKMVVKLSPNAENIVDLAKACEAEGADGISLVNTFLAFAIDIKKKQPVFQNGYAGLSGPAIKPIALRMVHQVSKAVQIPVMGMGGISTWQDAVEFIMAGASVIQVGTATFMKPDKALDIIDGLEQYCADNGLSNIAQIRGIV